MPRTEKHGRHRSATGRPVFMDASGRRLRHTRIAGLLTVAGVVAYMALVGSAFLGAPNIIGPLLPEAIVSQKRPAALAPAAPAAPPASQAPSAPAPETSVPPEPAPSPVSTAAPAPAPAPLPSSSPTSAPGRSATAPGQASRPPAP